MTLAFSGSTLLLLGLRGTFLYCLIPVFYRLFLSPLARFPSSKIAAATLLYEFYYEVIKRGQFTFKVREWHEQYGMFFRSLKLLKLTECRSHYQDQSARTACQRS